MPGTIRDFSIAEAIGSGFRLPRERPRAMLAWILVQLAFTAMQTAVAAPLAPSFARLREMLTESAPDPAQVSALLETMIPGVALMALLSLAAWAILAAAASRAILRPEESRMGYVRLGGDELRVFACLLIITAILMVAYMGGMFVVTAVLAVGGGAAGAQAGAILMFPVVAVGLVWLWSRLSLAPAMTLASGRVQAAGSWALTRGRAMRVFLVNLTALALSGVVLLLGTVIVSGVLGAVGMAPPTGESAEAYFSLPGLATIAASAVLAALGAAIVLCPPAVIFRRLAAERA